MRLMARLMVLLVLVTVAISCGNKVIQSQAGKLELERVEYLDRYPKDCFDSSPICNRAVEGFEIVLVTFRKLEPEATSKDNPLGDMSIDDLGVILRGADGSEDKPFLYGGGPEEIFVGFTPKQGQPHHVLLWPGNEDLQPVRQ